MDAPVNTEGFLYEANTLLKALGALAAVCAGWVMNALRGDVQEVKKKASDDSKAIWARLKEHEDAAGERAVRNAETFVHKDDMRALREEMKSEFVETRRLIMAKHGANQ